LNTVIGAAAGIGISWLMDKKWGKTENSSLTGAVKSGLKGLFGG